MSNGPRLFDRYKAIKDFEEILEDARMQAQTDWEETFVAEIKKKYDEYGGGMFWSEAQDLRLRKIAGTEDD